jgi:hypothetical protein
MRPPHAWASVLHPAYRPGRIGSPGARPRLGPEGAEVEDALAIAFAAKITNQPTSSKK